MHRLKPKTELCYLVDDGSLVFTSSLRSLASDVFIALCIIIIIIILYLVSDMHPILNVPTI